jgi:hypothetical protein
MKSLALRGWVARFGILAAAGTAMVMLPASAASASSGNLCQMDLLTSDAQFNICIDVTGTSLKVTDITGTYSGLPAPHPKITLQINGKSVASHTSANNTFNYSVHFPSFDKSYPNHTTMVICASQIPIISSDCSPTVNILK